jgi:predicted metal-dependent peptidase
MGSSAATAGSKAPASIAPQAALVCAETIQKARMRLLFGRRPVDAFYATLMWRIKSWVYDNPKVSTACTNGHAMMFNPAYVLELWTLDCELLISLIVHELMHVMFRHHLRRGRRMAWLWNVAGDLMINALMRRDGFTVAADWCLPGTRFKVADDKGKEHEFDTLDWPWNLSADEAYARLHSQLKRKGKKDDGQDDDDDAGLGGAGNPKEGEGTDGRQAGRNAGPRPGGVEDAPGEGEEGHQSAAAAEMDIASAINDAVAAANQRGDLPGGLGSIVKGLVRSQTCWEDELLEFAMACKGCDQPDYGRANRRYIPFGMIIPARAGLELDHLVIAIDTSGSCSGLQPRFAGVVKAIVDARPPRRMTVLWHDIPVNRVLDLDDEPALTFQPSMLLRAPGGGGTSHRPVFQRIADEDWTPTLMLCLTDLYTSFPASAPTWPVAWVVPAGNAAPVAPWGRVIHAK